MNQREIRSPPAGLFTLVGARALTDTPLQPHVVWVGEVRGDVYGIVTSPFASVIGVAPEDDLAQHALIGGIQRSLLSAEFVSLMETEPVDLDQIFDDLGTADFGADTVDVQGTRVPCLHTVYRGVEFVCGYDYLRWPFTVSRQASVGGPWPVLGGTDGGPSEGPLR